MAFFESELSYLTKLTLPLSTAAMMMFRRPVFSERNALGGATDDEGSLIEKPQMNVMIRAKSVGGVGSG